MVTILDHCPSCGKCSRPGVCPTDAIKVEDGKTFISEAGCIDCGLCIPVCPIGVIVETTAPKQEVDEEAPPDQLPEPVTDTTDKPSAVTGKEATPDGESPSTGI